MYRRKYADFSEMSDDEILNCVDRFISGYKRPYSREYSYDFVHALFCDYIKNPATKAAGIDLLARNLYMFLGNWGMLRNSFLLDANYTCLIGICETVCTKPYSDLLDVNIYGKDFDGDSYVETVFSLAEEIWRKLESVRREMTACPHGKKIYSGVTVTLVTKIMLVSLGCVPAYDSYAQMTLAKMHIGTSILAIDQVGGTKKEKLWVNLSETAKEDSIKLAKNNIRELLDFATARAKVFGDARNTYDAEREKDNRDKHIETVYYSDMKYVDMFLWSWSYRE